MDSRLIVGDNIAAKKSKRWVRSLGRILLPGGLFIIAFLRALSLSDGAVASDRMVLSKAAETLTVRSDKPSQEGER